MAVTREVARNNNQQSTINNQQSNEVFSCKLCGHCCHGESTVSLSQAEQKGIASFLGLDPADS
jgi:hypothetical protein